MRKLLLLLVLGVVACFQATTAAADPGPIQVSGQSATTSQQAAAASSATQVNPSNTNVSIRVLSPGNDGNVAQSNTAASSAAAGNAAGTGQTANQNAAGAGGVQTSQQSAGTGQLAVALSAASQYNPSNTNVPIRVLSPGNDGSVTQSNSTGSQAVAGNAAGTHQTDSQTQAAPSCGCSGTSGGVQTADQSASTDQAAIAASDAKQVDPSNTNVSIRVLSPGDTGSVSQSNSVGSLAAAGNIASTTQNGSQSQSGSSCGCSEAPTVAQGYSQSQPSTSCGCSGTPGVQQASQSAGTGQEAVGLSSATQIHPSNEASNVRVLSPGNDGNVSQSNNAGSAAIAGNAALTNQQATQTDGSGSGIQIGQQDAYTGQAALAASAAKQVGASNDASPVRVLSPGNGGNVSQSNNAISGAAAGNLAATAQNGTQNDAGSTCGCGGTGIQVLGQKSDTEQSSGAFSAAAQLFGGRSECGCGGSSGNEASPVRVYSPGNDGDVSQSNNAISGAISGNASLTYQNGSQNEAGGGLKIQALGQEATTLQDSAAASLAAQVNPSNDASPTSVYSPGNGGSVRQQNNAASLADSGNAAATGQIAGQTIGASSCGCQGLPIQVAGQSAWTGQGAQALSAAFQLYPQNDSSPTRVFSLGGGGSLGQSNSALSLGNSRNGALTGQGVSQKS